MLSLPADGATDVWLNKSGVLGRKDEVAKVGRGVTRKVKECKNAMCIG